jgi:2-polyprenyl-6-methoxyphenol hydroxylase-like FAD-dependent oxidoreductase
VPAIRRALVVGGGPAGATAAIALGRVGIETLVVESEDKARPVGIGFALQNSPLRALHHLGLLDAVVEHGFPHEAVNICAPDGTIVHRIITEPLVPDTPSLVAIPRVTMAEILDDAVNRTPGAEIRYRTTFAALRLDGDQVEAELTDGTTERFDLVIGADGLHSAVREQFFPDSPEPRLARQVIWRASAPRPPEADRYLLHDLGPGGRAAVVPISDDEVYLWRLHRDDGSPRPPQEQRLQFFRERLAPFGGVIPIVAERIRPESIDYRSLQALLVAPPWYRGRVVLIGDAAHTTTPHIAYGAGVAIEDSVVLAEELSRTDDLDTALETFMRRRFDRCKLVVESSLQLSEWEVDPPEDRSQHQQLIGRALGALSQPL